MSSPTNAARTGAGDKFVSYRVELLGGPLDGMERKVSRLPKPYVYVDLLRRRFCKAPGEHRYRYRTERSFARQAIRW